MTDSRPLDSLPFGKYKDVPIEDVPTDYLRWCIDNWDSSKHPDAYELVEAEYIQRKKDGRA